MSNELLSEKVSVNVNTSTLSEIDLLVDAGYFSNRSDFINYALRSAIDDNRSTINRLIEKNERKNTESHRWFIGVSQFSANVINEMYENGEKITLSGYGMLIIDEDCDNQKLFAVVESIELRGKAKCSPAIKTHYSLK